MPYDPHKHHRRSIRLKGYDYAQAGAYYVTICAQDRECMFGAIIDGKMIHNPAGLMVCDVWTSLPEKYPTVILDEFVVMPNHMHFIVFLTDDTADPDDRPETNVDVNSNISSDRNQYPDDHVGANPRVRPDSHVRPDAQASGEGQARGTGRSVEGQTRRSAPTGGDSRPTLFDVVRWFKSLTTAKYRHGVRDDEWPPFPGRVWQRNYYEHIIRNERSLNAIRQYIADNPANWLQDKLYEE